jgi:hypothetical protein
MFRVKPSTNTLLDAEGEEGTMIHENAGSCMPNDTASAHLNLQTAVVLHICLYVPPAASQFSHKKQTNGSENFQ